RRRQRRYNKQRSVDCTRGDGGLPTVDPAESQFIPSGMADGRKSSSDMLKASSLHKTAWILFFSLTPCYLALAPGTLEGRCYSSDDMSAGMSLLTSFNAWVKGRPVPPVLWTRHGPVPLLLDLPFLKLGKLFVTPVFAFSLEPVLLTAALMTIVFLWLSK